MKRQPAGSPVGGQFAPDSHAKRAPRLDKPDRDGTAIAKELREGIKAVRTSADWKRYLNNFSDMHQYSFLNSIFLKRQMPECSVVASYKKWEAKGIHVQKGQSALRVLAPMLVTDRDAQPDADGKLPQKLVGFKLVPVFDVSQTDANPEEWQNPYAVAYTQAKRSAGEAPEGLIDALEESIKGAGYTLQYGDVGLDGAYGVTIPSKKQVIVSDQLSPLRRSETLAHELGHIVMHVETDDPSDEGLHRGRKEFEAQSVAYTLLRSWGVDEDDAGASSFNYIASWTQNASEEDFEGTLIAITNKITKKRDSLPFPPSQMD